MVWPARASRLDSENMISFLNLQGWFKSKPAPIRWRDKSVLDVTLEEWRKNEQLVAEMAHIARQPVFQAMMQTLRTENPVNYVSTTAQPHDSIKHLGQIEGYQMALNNIEALGKLAKQQEPLVATFEAADNSSEP